MQNALRQRRQLVRGLSCLTTKRGLASSAVQRTAWGFIGLGQMGFNMAVNLHRQIPRGDVLKIYDVNGESTTRFAEHVQSLEDKTATVEIVSGAAEAARDVATLITVLPLPVHVRDVFDEIVTDSSHHSQPKRTFIDCSTIDPTTSRAIAAKVHQHDLGAFVDAPMSGGVVGAKAGTLTFMLGCPAELVGHLEPMLLKMGRRVLHCGKQGTGLSGKLANNYLLAINNIATAEAMNFGIRQGLDPRVLTDLLNVSTGRCWPSEINNPVPGVIAAAPASRDYQGGFGTSLMRKDLGLAVDAAADVGAKMVLASTAQSVYADTDARSDCRGRDFSVVYRWLGGANTVTREGDAGPSGR